MRALAQFVLVTAAILAALTSSSQDPFSLDTTFRANLVEPFITPGYHVSGILPMDDGRVIVSGHFRFPDDPMEFPAINRGGARLYPDGSRDTTFNEWAPLLGKIVPWSDEKFYVGNPGPTRVDMEGYVDTTYKRFFQIPYLTPLFYGDYHVISDGRVVVGGGHTLSDSIRGFIGVHNFIWMTNTGYLDTTRVHRKGNGYIGVITELPDGKFIVSCGQCTVQDNLPVNKIFRLHPDGALDTTFQSPIEWGAARSITALDDGRFLVSGLFGAPSIYPDSLHFVRLMPDGAIDPSFNNEIDVFQELPGYGQFVNVAHSRLDNGRIVMHARFSSVEGQDRNGIALLDENGQLLDAFTNAGCGPYLHADGNMRPGSTGGLAEGADGMFYIHGSYVGYDEDPQQRLVSRLYPDDFTTTIPEDVGTVAERISIAPNPASGLVRFTWPGGSNEGTLDLIIRDLTGRSIYETRLGQQRGQYTWDSGTVSSGVYMVEIRQHGALLMPAERVIIHH